MADTKPATQRYHLKSNQEQGRWRNGQHIPMSGVELDLSEADLLKFQADPSLTIRPAGLKASDVPRSPAQGDVQSTEQSSADLSTRPAGVVQKAGPGRRE